MGWAQWVNADNLSLISGMRTVAGENWRGTDSEKLTDETLFSTNTFLSAGKIAISPMDPSGRSRENLTIALLPPTPYHCSGLQWGPLDSTVEPLTGAVFIEQCMGS